MKGNKKKKQKQTLPKYFLGGNTDDLLQGYLDIRNERIANRPGQIENPNTALADNAIRMARAKEKAARNPWTTGLDIFGNLAMQVGSSMMNKGMSQGQGVSEGGFNWGGLLKGGINTLGASSQFAMGGDVDGMKQIEAEGKEIVETPDGQMAELKGPSHEQGGIDIEVPGGTEIFSKRLQGPDGKSMADRKKRRERAVKKIEKLLEKTPSDKALRKTLERTIANNEREEAADMAKMNLAKQMYQAGQAMMGGKMDYATGGTIPPIDLSFLSNLFNPQIPQMTGTSDDYHIIDDGHTEYQRQPVQSVSTIEPAGIQPLTTSGPTASTVPDLATPGIVPEGDEGGNFNFLNDIFGGEGGGLTLGDTVGFAGNLISTFGPMKNTRANRAGDTPNINFFKDYGKEGLRKLDDSKQFVAGQRDKALQDLEQTRSGAIRRGRNTARGVNTMRALDLATTLGTNDAQVDVHDNFSRIMQGIFAQESQLENQQDQVVMQGEQNRDLADRQDRDNFYTQMAQDIATKGYGLQKIGKDINQVKTRNITQKTLNQLYPNFDWDGMSGELKGKAVQDLKENKDYYGGLSASDQYAVMEGRLKKGWTIKDNKLYNKSGMEINPDGSLSNEEDKKFKDELFNFFNENQDIYDRLVIPGVTGPDTSNIA